VPAPATDVSYDYRSRVDAKPDGELHTVAGLQTRIQSPNGLDECHARVHRPLCIVFMRLWVAKVDQQTIPEVLRNMPLVALNHHSRSLLIGPHNGPEVFRVKLPREHCRAYQVAEQHGQLPPFGLVGPADRLRCCPGDVRRRGWMAVVRSRSPWRWRSSGCAVHGYGRVMVWYYRWEPSGWRFQPVSGAHSGQWQFTHGRRLIPPDQALPMLIAGDRFEEQLIPYCLHQRLVEATELHKGAIGESAFVLEEHERQMERAIQAYPVTICASCLRAERGIQWAG
jgi:hypothetical protein